MRETILKKDLSLSHSRINHMLIISMILISLGFVVTLLYRCNFGIELTDEGYYLNWISNPWLYKSSVSQFGYMYHPLYRLVGENIVLLRQADMLILFGLSWLLCVKLFHYTFHENNDPAFHVPTYYIYGLSFALASCIFIFFEIFWWIPTPNYNSLLLESTLIISIALLSHSTQKHACATPWILFGFGCWLAFMAKPSAAIILGFISLLYVLCLDFKKLKIRHLLLSFMTLSGLIFLSAWLIDGSIHTFIKRLHDGIGLLALAYEDHLFQFLPRNDFPPDAFTQTIFALLTALTFLLTCISSHKKNIALLVYLFALLVALGLICTNHYIVPFILHPQVNILILAIPLGSISALICMLHKKTRNQHLFNYLMLSFYLGLLPYAMALGTHIDLGLLSFRFGFFWILAIFPLIGLLKQASSIRWQIMTSIILSSQLLTASLVQGSMERPYRQTQPLRTQTKILEIRNTQGKITSHLFVSNTIADYINKLRRVSFDHGFSYGDPMIDFTGLTPTALYLLGAQAIGTPWYTIWPVSRGLEQVGNPDFVLATLSKTPCEMLANAWVLTSPESSHDPHYDLRLLEAHGIHQTAYQAVGTTIPTFSAMDPNAVQLLMKPIKPYPETTLTCKKTRAPLILAQQKVGKALNGKTPLTQTIINLSQDDISKNKLEEAAVLLKNAIIINPIEPVLYNNLCFTYALQKKYNLASVACLKALELNPTFNLARNNLNWVEQEKRSQEYLTQPHREELHGS